MVNKLLNRVLVASALIPPAVWLVFQGELSAFIALEIVIGIVMYEFYSLLPNSKDHVNKWTGIVIGMIIPFFYYLDQGIINKLFIRRDRALLLLLVLVTITFIIKRVIDVNIKESLKYISYTIFGIIYISVLLTHLWFLKTISFEPLNFFGFSVVEGKLWLFTALLLAFVSDSAAYFVGRAFGRRQLSPRISPKKTVEGFIGSMVVNTLLGITIKLTYFPFLSWANAIIIGCGSAIFAQLGDLGASLFKREYDVKDSSHLLMEHGGAYDRLDSVLFVAPILYYYVRFFV